jgi:hypothetical protein
MAIPQVLGGGAERLSKQDQRHDPLNLRDMSELIVNYTLDSCSITPSTQWNLV